LAATNKSISRVSRGDALRIKRDYAWYFKSQAKKENKNFKDFCNGAKAPLYHHFSVHHWCDGDWCWAKRLDDEEDNANKCQVTKPGERQTMK
jgi:hypothetical protein